MVTLFAKSNGLYFQIDWPSRSRKIVVDEVGFASGLLCCTVLEALRIKIIGGMLKIKIHKCNREKFRRLNFMTKP